MSDCDDELPPDELTTSERQTGYGKPPVEHRFKKGVSGNPRGRPKGSRRLPNIDAVDDSLSAFVRAEGRRMMSVREGDAVRQMPMKKVILRNTFTAAAKGDGRALKVALGMLEIADNEANEQVVELQKASLQLQEYWNSWCLQNKKQHSVLTDLPKPAHVTIDPSTGFAIWNSPWLRKTPVRLERYRDYPSDWLTNLAQICSSMNEKQKLYGQAIKLGRYTVALSILQQALDERGPLAAAQRYCELHGLHEIARMTPQEARDELLERAERAREKLAANGTNVQPSDDHSN